MKSTIALAIAFAAIPVMAMAAPKQEQGQAQGQLGINEQAQGQLQGQQQGQGQAQGQIGINESTNKVRNDNANVGVNANENFTGSESSSGSAADSGSTSGSSVDNSISNPVVSGSSSTSAPNGAGNSTTTNVDNSQNTDYKDLIIPATLPSLPMNTQPGMAVSCSTMAAQFDYTGGFGGGVGVLNLFSFQGSVTPNNIPKEGLKIAELVATCGMTDQLNGILDALSPEEALAYKQELAKFIMHQINPEFKYSNVLVNQLNNHVDAPVEPVGIWTAP